MFDHDLVMKASQFAALEHRDQLRRDGKTPYFSHPARVAITAMLVFGDSDMVAAALLHDVVEDCGITVQHIEAEFGMPVAAIVEALTNVKQPRLLWEQQKAADRDRLVAASPEVQQLKLLDRLDNLRELSHDWRLLPPVRPNDRAWSRRYVRESRLLAAALRPADDKQLADAVDVLCDQIDAMLPLPPLSFMSKFAASVTPTARRQLFAAITHGAKVTIESQDDAYVVGLAGGRAAGGDWRLLIEGTGDIVYATPLNVLDVIVN